MTAEVILALALALNAALGFGYRVYRLSKGGPVGDVYGQAILGALLAVMSAAVFLGAGWARWPALIYGVVFGVLVMPLWTLAVLIPLPPGPPDYAFAAVYWVALVVVVIAAIAL